MFFESERDKRAYFSKKDNVCGAHFHRSAELLYTLSGEKTAWLNGKKYTLTAGQLLFCPPYAIHTFPPCTGSEQIVAAVPADYCGRFEKYCETHSPETPVLTDKDGTLLRLISSVRKQIGKTTYIVRVHFSQTAKKTAPQACPCRAPRLSAPQNLNPHGCGAALAEYHRRCFHKYPV